MQTPFVTLGFGLGKGWAAELIQKSILQNRIAGLGKHKKTAIFPKLVYTLKDGHNLKETDPQYEIKQLALECASKRMYPDVLNYHQVIERTGSFKLPMGCRSFLNRYEEHGEEIHEGRNNLGVVSLNLPRIAIESNGDWDKFNEILDERLSIAKDALMYRISRFDGVKASVAPILYMEGACGVRLKADDYVADIFKNGRASISLGYIGLHEVATLMSEDPEHTLDSKDKQDIAMSVLEKLRTATETWKDETGYGFSLYSTPSESLCDRFCRMDVEKFGVIEGINDKEYYTNSFHLDVFKKTDPFSKIQFESVYPSIASGGFISYTEFPVMTHNLEGLEAVWDYAYRFIPYFGTNTPIDECYVCGFKGEALCTDEGFKCPTCGAHGSGKLSVTRRVCGYLGDPGDVPWNNGKQTEMQNRVKHEV